MTISGIAAQYFVRNAFLRKISWYLDSLAKIQKAERLRKKFRQRLVDLKTRYAYKPWRTWLKEQAEQENKMAVKAIEARGIVLSKKIRHDVDLGGTMMSVKTPSKNIAAPRRRQVVNEVSI